VAAYDHKSATIASFSSRGPSKWDGGVGPTISAPGNAIRSAVPSGGLGPGGLYDYKSGTSMAGPHVAAAAALLWSARPDLIGNIPATAEILKSSARPLTTTQNCGAFPGNKIPNAVFGFGLLDVFKALNER
jgi:serine protease AprX